MRRWITGTLVLCAATVALAADDASPNRREAAASTNHEARVSLPVSGPTLAEPGRPSTPMRWGRDGHIMVGLAAAAGLPADMPAFFRHARQELGWLNYDPDRWRNPGMVESNEAWQYDHFIDLEAVPDGALDAPDRFAWLLTLKQAGIAEPQKLGLLPFRIIELTERLTQEFGEWRQATDPQVRGFLERRIINDAGILGHYVADGANPHHSTIHFNGWAADKPNPEGYTTDRTFHRRFESDYVSSHIEPADVGAAAATPARVIDDVRGGVIAYLRQTNDNVRRLYDLEKIEPFSDSTKAAGHRAFTLDRLATGAAMLRSIWYTAWKRSQTPG